MARIELIASTAIPEVDNFSEDCVMFHDKRPMHVVISLDPHTNCPIGVAWRFWHYCVRCGRANRCHPALNLVVEWKRLHGIVLRQSMMFPCSNKPLPTCNEIIGMVVYFSSDFICQRNDLVCLLTCKRRPKLDRFLETINGFFEFLMVLV